MQLFNPLQTDLSTFTNPHFNREVSRWKELLWMVCSAVFFRHSLALGNGLKGSLLRAFGARIGEGVLIKPSVQIKFPWKLVVGDHCWLGEGVWIDNLAPVTLGDHVCVSQGALLLTGNHDYKRTTFDLRASPIRLETGAWVGARGLVAPGVTVGSHAVLAAGSVATGDLEAYMVYQGNPAGVVRRRVIVGESFFNHGGEGGMHGG